MRQHRSLTPNEQAVLERLLSVDFQDVEYFREQIEAITVTSKCGCGCGTIGFSVDARRARRAPSPDWEGLALLVESDSNAWLMVFQSDGWLSELEHVPDYGPRPDDLDPAGIEPKSQVEADWLE